MSALGRDVRAALQVARLADAAPSTIRLRGRHRLMSALAGGTASTSVAVAIGADLKASSAAMTAGTAVSSTTSLAGTLVSAVCIGLSSGLVALSPNSRVPERPSSVVAQLAAKSEASVGRAAPNVGPSEYAALEDLSAHEASTPIGPTAVRASEDMQRIVLTRRAPPTAASPQPTESLGVGPGRDALSAAVAPTSPIKASIARELALIADVRRALLNGQAEVAVTALDRHAEEFPAGAMAEEAIASRIVALCTLGRVDEAQRWAAQFQRRYPNSPQLRRVRRACSAHTREFQVGAQGNEPGRTIP